MEKLLEVLGRVLSKAHKETGACKFLQVVCLNKIKREYLEISCMIFHNDFLLRFKIAYTMVDQFAMISLSRSYENHLVKTCLSLFLWDLERRSC